MVMQRQSFAARRRLLAAFGVGALVPPVASFLMPTLAQAATEAGKTPRVVVMDWGLGAQILALGVVPVGMSRPPWYRALAGTPEMPPSVVDTGLLFQPNFEVVQALRPDLIVVTPLHAPLFDSLSRIARVFVAPAAHRHEDGYLLARRRVQALGEALARPAAATRLIEQTDARLTTLRTRIAQHGAANRPVYLITPIDTRLTAVFGSESVFGGTLNALGLTNAWRRPSDTEGMAQVDYTQIGGDASARAMLIGSSPQVVKMLGQSPLWQALPFVHGGRMSTLPMMLPTGGTPTALRLADALTAALTGGAA
ncbi:ABC transporter substrate-binding protein [Pandoraea norimbergensis]|uniref:Fe/B12 periplasmic-binding domain-containing protein n=1 Tax=Pandoraea norimbergensis TaxID=93219 RepID=A0ABN4JN39_9BURK|nr:ABC transporter substrate-binding protein [Pandoraea norimbergensis]